MPVLALAAILSAPPARSAEPASPAIEAGIKPAIKIDDSRSPAVTIEARDIPVPDLLKELSTRLHFAVEGLSALDREEKVTISSNGDIEDILRRIVLPGKAFVTFYRGKAIERIVIVDSNGAGNSAQPAIRQAEAQKPPGHPTEPQSPARTEAPTAPAPTSAKAAPVPRGAVNTLLQAQLNLQQQAGAGTGLDNAAAASALQPAGSSANSPGQAPAAAMAALTQTARQNVLALSSALRAVCIGPNCAQ